MGDTGPAKRRGDSPFPHDRPRPGVCGYSESCVLSGTAGRQTLPDCLIRRHQKPEPQAGHRVELRKGTDHNRMGPSGIPFQHRQFPEAVRQFQKTLINDEINASGFAACRDGFHQFPPDRIAHRVVGLTEEQHRRFTGGQVIDDRQDPLCDAEALLSPQQEQRRLNTVIDQRLFVAGEGRRRDNGPTGPNGLHQQLKKLRSPAAAVNIHGTQAQPEAAVFFGDSPSEGCAVLIGIPFIDVG